MSYEQTIAMTVEAAIADGKTIADVTVPLIDQIARAVVIGLKRNADNEHRRAARDGMVEIIRNQLDEAVARHDQHHSA